jgi:gentisate 1,2-dioxygenase
MSQQDFHMAEPLGVRSKAPDVWPPLRVPGDAIAREIERLADAPRPPDGRRASTIVNARARAPGLGFAPGVDVTIHVLRPGESTRPLRRNSNQVEFCIAGAGTVAAGAARLHLGKWDVGTIPSMQTYSHHNDGPGLWVWLSYSNAPLLEKLGIHYIEEADTATPGGNGAAGQRPAERYTRQHAPDIPIGTRGARMRGYEFLTDIEVVPSIALHWPWAEIARHVSRQVNDGKRGIMLLYNPATERRNGTTHSFFATISSTPAGAPPRPHGRGHRHSSVAINYHFEGAGRSTVDGQVIEWQAGDLLLSAPAWSEHAHYIHPQGASVLTIQDHPLHIGMESLIWQERMDGPILTLGSEAGQTGYVGPRIAGA